MKIKNANLDNILQKATAKEIDLILEIAQYQDIKGNIEGIQYKDIVKNINIDDSTFFKLIYSLEQKEIIKINYLNANYGFWNITILDNSFTEPSDFKEGYLNINNTFLHSDAFKSLKCAEKVIILNLFRIANNRHYIRITRQKLMYWTNCKIQSIRKYIKTLNKFFNINKDNNTYIFYTNDLYFEKADTEKNIKNKHLIKYLVKRNRSVLDNSEVDAVSGLFNQYAKVEPALIFEVIENSIKNIGILNVKYIHKYLANKLKYIYS